MKTNNLIQQQENVCSYLKEKKSKESTLYIVSKTNNINWRNDKQAARRNENSQTCYRDDGQNKYYIYTKTNI